jgi:hypothetical protein
MSARFSASPLVKQKQIARIEAFISGPSQFGLGINPKPHAMRLLGWHPLDEK